MSRRSYWELSRGCFAAFSETGDWEPDERSN
nr:unnamed protein product [Callosobruchus analis]